MGIAYSFKNFIYCSLYILPWSQSLCIYSLRIGIIFNYTISFNHKNVGKSITPNGESICLLVLLFV